MAFTKIIKNKAYFKRFQVKYRRRREGKTDYYARKRLVVQDKNKYNSPKYRLVVRFTNKDIVAQIVHAKIEGDAVFCAAYSHELPRYGLSYGLTNWSAAYATGLLLARRALAKLKLDEKYEGVTEPNGEFSIVEPVEGEARPFKVYLDVGTRRTTTGARIFGCMKGASDGGLYIPHNEKRFPGYDADSKELDSEVLRNYIFGEHVAEYMRMLEDEDPERYAAQFSKLIKDGVSPDDLEDIYAKTHAAIREDPSPAPKKEHDMTALRKASQKYKQHRRNKAQRENRVKQKKAAFEKLMA